MLAQVAEIGVNLLRVENGEALIECCQKVETILKLNSAYVPQEALDAAMATRRRGCDATLCDAGGGAVPPREGGGVRSQSIKFFPFNQSIDQEPRSSLGSSFPGHSAAAAISLALPCPATMATTASAASPALTPELVPILPAVLWAVATTPRGGLPHHLGPVALGLTETKNGLVARCLEPVQDSCAG